MKPSIRFQIKRDGRTLQEVSDRGRQRLQSGYNLGVEGGGSEKDVTPHPLPDKGLRLENKWRGRRGSKRSQDELQRLA